MNEKKILLVTGASSDLGSALIRKVAPDFDFIIAHYRHSGSVIEELKDLFKDRIIPVSSDFSSIEDTYAFVDKIESLGIYPTHIVHLPADKLRNSHFHKSDWDTFQNEIDISLRSAVIILQHFIKNMAKNRYGKIVIMLSSVVKDTPPNNMCDYVTVKYSLFGMMKSLAVEYASKGVCINAVSPDMIETRFVSEIPELIRQINAQNSPTGKNLDVKDVIPSIEYLLSDESDNMTGQNIFIPEQADCKKCRK